MYIDFNKGIGIACACLFIVLIILILIVVFGGCETIEEDIGLTASNSENSIVENPVNKV